MAPRKGRGRGRANQAPAKRASGVTTARARSSGPHSREGVRALQHAQQLPTPENTNPSLGTPTSLQETAEQLMAPVRDPNNVDGTRPWKICRPLC
jgi:hypothetical protein